MLYNEDKQISAKFRKDYFDSIVKMTEMRQAEADRNRAEYISPGTVAAFREEYRKDLTAYIGWPLTEYDSFKDVPVNVRKEKRLDEDFATIWSMQFEVMPGFWFYGLYLETKNPLDSKPFVIAQHGGAGQPETICEMWGASNYSHVPERFARKGCNVFCPALMLWAKEDGPEGVEKYRVFDTNDRDYSDTRLHHVGSSMTAIEVFAIRRILSYFISEGIAHEGHIGMAGLSYGGYYTIRTAALEPKIDAAYSSCQFSSRYVYEQWPDWIYDGIAHKFLDAEIASLIAPRPLFLEEGDSDEFFKPEPFLRECERTLPFYEAQRAADKLCYRVFKGGHQFAEDDEGIDFIMNAIG